MTAEECVGGLEEKEKKMKYYSENRNENIERKTYEKK
jgi:hypothetical protein